MSSDAPSVVVPHRGIRRLNIVILAFTLIAIVVSVVSGVRSQGYAHCQAKLNDILIERTRILGDVGARERAAERTRDDALDAAFLDPAITKPNAERTPQERRRLILLLGAYTRAARAVAVERVQADKARAQYPLPPAPSKTC